MRPSRGLTLAAQGRETLGSGKPIFQQLFSEAFLRLFLIWPVLALTASLFAQPGEYAGPSVLSRGGGGGARPSTPISFRPYFNLSAMYDDGMSASPDASGQLRSGAVTGGEAAAGLYGYHSWKHTVLGVNYRGDYRRYNRKTGYDGTTQLLTFGLTHQPTKKLELTFREGVGTFTQNTGYGGTFGFFDPTFAQIPHNELLDSRTDYVSTMADAAYLMTRRLSFNFGGTGFLVRRRVSSFYGVTGSSARADMAYRLTRRSTIAGDYFFTHFEFNKVFGASDIHSVAADYSIRLSRSWELALRAGVIRAEMLSMGVVSIDPLVAAIIGRPSAFRAFYRREAGPTYAGQLQRFFRRAAFQAGYSNGVTPGNGIYMASRQNTASAILSYTGMRYWSLNAGAYYSDMRSIGQDIGRYRTGSAGLSAARSIASRNLFFTARLDARRYLAGEAFRRTSYHASVGIAYSPGDVPLRLW